MHGTAQFTALITLTGGGAVASLPSTHFNAIELWSEAERLRAAGDHPSSGMAFAQPMLEALDANPGRWDLSRPAPHRLLGHGVEHGEQAGAAEAPAAAAPSSTA